MFVEDQNAGADRRKPRFQISLRSLLTLTVSLAVGMTIGAAPALETDDSDSIFDMGVADLDWHFALLAAASTSMAIGLLQEACALRRHLAELAVEQPRATLALEVYSRVGLALILITSLAIRLLVDRGFFTLPEKEGARFFYGDVMTMHVWWLALGIALTEKLRRERSPSKSRRGRVVTIVTSLGAAAICACILVYMLCMTFLVHEACRGNDASQAIADQRYPIYTIAEQKWLALFAAGGYIAVLLAATFLIGSLRQTSDRGHERRFACGLGMLLVAGAAAFSSWFYWRRLPTISPDLAYAGVSGTWFQLLGGGVLAAMAVTYAAYRVARTSDARRLIQRWHPAHDLSSLATMLLLLVAAIVFFVQHYRSAVETVGWWRSRGVWIEIGETIAEALASPDAYFMLAITVLSVQLAWSQSSRKRDPELAVYTIDGRRFTAALVVFTALTLVAIPTFLAASFAFWLGPWYRW
jgi:hypothetical protein